MRLETITHYFNSQASVVEEVTDRWGQISGRWMGTTQLRDDLFASPSEIEVAELLARKLDAHEYLVHAVRLLIEGVSLDMRDGRRAQAMELGKFALEKAEGSSRRLLPSSPLFNSLHAL